jgi:hypothetical protein
VQQYTYWIFLLLGGFMKKLTLVATAIAAAVLSGCGTTSMFGSKAPEPAPVTAVKETETRLTTEFRREGVRVFYTMTGDVDRIEARGYAQAWQQQYEHVAELEAKEKMIKFLRGETVSSTRKTAVIARAIERAQDNTLNHFKTVDGAVDISADDAESADAGAKIVRSPEENSRNNTALRRASINNAQTVTSNITVTASGRLTAVSKKSGEMIDNGRTYMAIYVWTPRDQTAARKISAVMDQP